MKLGISGYSRYWGNVLTVSQEVSSARPPTFSYPPAPFLSPFLDLRLITVLSPCEVAPAQSQVFGTDFVHPCATNPLIATNFPRLCEATFQVREVAPLQGWKHINVLKA